MLLFYSQISSMTVVHAILNHKKTRGLMDAVKEHNKYLIANSQHEQTTCMVANRTYYSKWNLKNRPANNKIVRDEGKA